MSPKLTPEEKRRRLFQRINGIRTGREGTDGILRIHLTQRNRDDLEEGERDLAKRRAKVEELSPAELHELGEDQDTMNQTLTAIELWGS